MNSRNSLKAKKSISLWEQFILDTQKNPDNFGELIHLAVSRHLNDLKESTKKNYPFYFDEISAQKVISFISLLRQSKGQYYNQPFQLLPWQGFALANLYGWKKKKTKTRKYKQAVIEIGRGNGKTTLLSGLAIYSLFIEPGANSYCTANSREQANLLFSQVAETVQLTPGLEKYLTAQTYSIKNKKNLSYLKKLSGEKGINSLDGGNSSLAVVDEIAVMSGEGKLWNVIKGGMSKRIQPLLFGISSASSNGNSFGKKMRDYGTKVLKVEHKDDTHFHLCFTLDENDDFDDSKNWIKANPSLGVTLSLQELKESFNSVTFDEAGKADFYCKRLNIYSTGSTAWIHPSFYIRNAIDKPDIKERAKVFIGIDASLGGDFFAVSYTYPEYDFYSEFQFFLPGKDIQKRFQYENSKYRDWINQGYIKLLGDETINRDLVGDEILSFINEKNLNVQNILYDNHSVSFLKGFCEKNSLPHKFVLQNYREQFPANEILGFALKEDKIKLQKNPVLFWMAENVVARIDTKGNLIFEKSDYKKRKDGIDALTRSFYFAKLWKDENENKPLNLSFDSPGVWFA